MKNDFYGILKKSTELIEKHMELKPAQGFEAEQFLTSAYSNAEKALLSHIKTAVMPIKTVSELVDCFSDACYGLSALGMRQDLMRMKLLGVVKAGQEALYKAIDKDTREQNLFVQNICDDNFPINMDALDASLLSAEAYSTPPKFLGYKPDRKALAYVYLLGYLQTDTSNTGPYSIAQDIQHNSCLKWLLGETWATRSVIGYFDNYWHLKTDIDNREFIDLFGSRLAEILKKGKNYFEELQIKQILQKQVVSIFVGNLVAPIEVYIEIDKLIIASKSAEGITQAVADEASYSYSFALTKIYDGVNVRYEINITGLQALASALEALGLDGLQEVNVILGRIRALAE